MTVSEEFLPESMEKRKIICGHCQVGCVAIRN